MGDSSSCMISTPVNSAASACLLRSMFSCVRRTVQVQTHAAAHQRLSRQSTGHLGQLQSVTVELLWGS